MTNVLAFKPTKKEAPTNVKSTVGIKERDYTTKDEVELLCKLAKKTRNGAQMALMINMAFRHGLRIGELVELRWAQVMLKDSKLVVYRLKNGDDSKHPIQGDELRALRALKRESNNSSFVFITERQAPYTTDGFRKKLSRMIAKHREDNPTDFDFKLTPHSLRHGCGHYLANEKRWETRRIQEYLGHKNINHTVTYTKLAGHKFDDLTF